MHDIYISNGCWVATGAPEASRSVAADAAAAAAFLAAHQTYLATD